MSRLVECKQGRSDCFAYFKGGCKALGDTRFTYPCPFYKKEEEIYGYSKDDQRDPGRC